MSEQFKCLICGKELETANYNRKPQDDPYNIGSVHDAVICRIHGNFGSTVYDPLYMDEFLECYICDKCLVEKNDLIKRIVVKKETTQYRVRIGDLKGLEEEIKEQYSPRCPSCGAVVIEVIKDGTSSGWVCKGCHEEFLHNQIEQDKENPMYSKYH